jgi:anti-sigma B factor antagonist
MSTSLSGRPQPSAAAEPAKPRISLTTLEGVAWLHVQGDIDLASADHLRALGQDAISDFVGTIRINLADVTFIDSTGLAALVAIRNAALDAGRVMVLEQPPQQVRRVLEATGLDGVFTVDNA